MHDGLAKLSAHQLGLVTLTQLHGLGLSTDQSRWLVRCGVLVLIRKQVYRVAGVPISWEQAVLAAVLGAGPDGVISHATAAAVWNLRHSDRHSAGIHITRERRTRVEGVTCHQSRLTPAEWTVRGAMPITTVERTIIDLAGTLTATELAQCVDDAIRRNMMSLERLRRLVAQAAAPGGGRRLLKPVHQVLAERIPGYRPDDSDFETEMNRMWDALGLPAAQRQHRVTIDGHAYRLDRAIVERKIATEWDSYCFHSSPSDRDYDSNRRARLVGAGWLIIPVTAHSEPELVSRAVLRAFRDRGGTGGPGR